MKYDWVLALVKYSSLETYYLNQIQAPYLIRVFENNLL